MQASKQQRKFTVAPHNMSYAAVADLNRHIFVYRQVATATHLRNRKSGQNVDKVAKQVRAHQNHFSRLGRLLQIPNPQTAQFSPGLFFAQFLGGILRLVAFISLSFPQNFEFIRKNP